MKITQISCWEMPLPFIHPYVYSGGRRTLYQLDSMVLRIDTDEGLAGWGEGCPFGPTYAPAFAKGVAAGVAELAPHLLGQDPRRIDCINRIMDASLPGHPYVKTALDMACWDILGKFAGLPLCELFGGRTDDPVRLHSSLSTGTPQQMVAEVEAARAKGYRVHSCKVGGDDVATDVARIRAVANSLTDAESVTFDVNCAWLPDIAIQVMNAVRDLRVYFEQPCGTYEECLKVRRATIQPIILDESINTYQDVVRAYSESACEGVGIKIGRVGGLTKAKAMRDFCVEMGIRMNIEDTGGGALTDTAAVHLAQATPVTHRRGTVLYHEMVTRDIAPGQGVRNAGGFVHAPDLAGIGVAPDTDLLGAPTAQFQL